ncbi:hypothetical protein HZS_4568 [Henneguya salminicola]|nr:hypothetical protein HZS_4568 [Henneguya salminicola]
MNCVALFHNILLGYTHMYSINFYINKTQFPLQRLKNFKYLYDFSQRDVRMHYANHRLYYWSDLFHFQFFRIDCIIEWQIMAGSDLYMMPFDESALIIIQKFSELLFKTIEAYMFFQCFVHSNNIILFNKCKSRKHLKD